MPTLFVGQAATVLCEQGYDVSPKLLTEWLYLGKLDNERCPLYGGRRVIPREYLPEIARELRRAGRVRHDD